MAIEQQSSDPGAAVEEATDRVLKLAATWPAWRGDVKLDENGREHTPHKAIRRYADHLIDHLAQVEDLLAGRIPQPDRWGASAFTSDADRAPFTETDLREATERITRLSRMFRLRLLAAGEGEWDRLRGEDWTLRQIAEHLANPYFAEQVGDLSDG